MSAVSGSTPNSRNRGAFSADRLTPKTWCPARANSPASGRPMYPQPTTRTLMAGLCVTHDFSTCGTDDYYEGVVPFSSGGDGVIDAARVFDTLGGVEHFQADEIA